MVFQNIVSGKVQRDPRTARIFPDLDSRTLARRVCSPVRVPPNGTIAFEGRFVLVIAYQQTTFLQKCGTRLHEPAGYAGLGSSIGPNAVIYVTGPHQPINGISLPDLQQFTIALPHGAEDIIGANLSLDHIYVEAQTRSGRYNVWSAPASALSTARSRN